MPSQCFVVDEWLIHDLVGDNRDEAQDQSFRFMKKLKQKCDRIAVLIGSPWMDKAYALMTDSNPPVRQLSKYLHLSILLDSKKCQMIDPTQVENLQQDLKDLVPEEDRYLIGTYYSAKADALVTTDTVLHENLSAEGVHIVVKLRNDFLNQYLS